MEGIEEKGLREGREGWRKEWRERRKGRKETGEMSILSVIVTVSATDLGKNFN